MISSVAAAGMDPRTHPPSRPKRYAPKILLGRRPFQLNVITGGIHEPLRQKFMRILPVLIAEPADRPGIDDLSDCSGSGLGSNRSDISAFQRIRFFSSVVGKMDRSFLKMRCTRGRGLFLFYLFAVLGLMAQPGACNVVLMANNTTLSFDDVEATFTPAVEGSGVNGVIYVVEPLDACSPLRTKADGSSAIPFALITRGRCQFDDKVRNAQQAGFKAAVVYDNEDSGVLVSKFHAACVDLWLTSWRTFCPVCKRDANTGTSNPPVSESTPLLSSAIRLPAGSASMASFRSTVAASPPRPISRHPSAQSMFRTYSISGYAQSLPGC
ncbi:hypothetical protein PR202_gb29065 [Eleusine coracana subsp. coracana]|uniref:PA domain-containing protein n=1 Tax=Eleusine coracana subsp. coracana TaxID=191504 RepID=A0AAV5FZC5_ELECO|nr:hypothetical protein PR202_gb29065 [Eleusine coracana subsp. coracana]